METLSFVMEFHLDASVDEVMELLTDSEKISEWGGGEALVEKKIGGQVEMFDGWVEGKVLKITDLELAYTWKPSDWDEKARASEVIYKLEAAQNGTKVILEHSGFPNKQEMENHKTGWIKHFFGPIEVYLKKQ